MSVLPAQTIRRLAKSKEMIVPFVERGIFNGKTHGLGPSTYDMRIRETIVLYPWHARTLFRSRKAIDWVRNFFHKPTIYDNHHLGFILASSIERVKMPDDVGAQVMDKSSWARKGLSVFNTHFDPGFEGYPTLELVNHGPKILHIPAGIAICQFKFERMESYTEMPYKGKYLNQPPRPVEAIEGIEEWA